MPGAMYWKAALCILACMKGPREYGIIYQRGTMGNISLEVFTDADYVSKAIDKPSMSGGAVMCGGACVFFVQDSEYVGFGDTVTGQYFRGGFGLLCCSGARASDHTLTPLL